MSTNYTENTLNGAQPTIGFILDFTEEDAHTHTHTPTEGHLESGKR